MDKPLLLARLAELSSSAEVVRLRLEKGHHWERELSQECKKLKHIASERSRLAEFVDNNR